MRFARRAMLASLVASVLSVSARADGPVDFNRDVRPILSNHCFVCHGPDSNLRKAKLRLDDEKDAHAKALVAGKPDESELYKRVVSTDLHELMPPAKANKPLNKDQVAVLRR